MLCSSGLRAGNRDGRLITSRSLWGVEGSVAQKRHCAWSGDASVG